MALVGLTANVSATTISITYTGQIFGGTANSFTGTFCGSCSPSQYTFTGQNFTLNYFFDTSAASLVYNPSFGGGVGGGLIDPTDPRYPLLVGDYLNSGSSSFLAGTYSGKAGGTFVGSAAFATIAGGYGGFGVNPTSCIGDQFCASRLLDASNYNGSPYTQSASMDFTNQLFRKFEVQTALFSNPAIPGDITTAFSLSGSNIGSGHFNNHPSS